MGKSSLFFLCFFSALVSLGQQQTYFVQFKDKVNSPYSLDHPEAFLSAKAIARKSKCLVSIDERDMPVSQAYIDQVIQTGAQFLYALKWFNGIVVRSDAAVKNQISSLGFVTDVHEAVKLRTTHNSASQSLLREDKTSVSDFGDTYVQNEMLGISLMHEEGYKGEGILIAVTDDGFLNVNINHAFKSLFQEGRVLGTWDFVDLDTSVYAQGGGHGAEVLSILAGSVSGQFLSPALGADYLLFRTEDVSSESPLEELNWVKAAEVADSAGADIIQVSLGYSTFDDASLDYEWSDLDGRSSYISKGAAWAYEKGLVVVASAGNEGASSWRKVICPADVDGVVAVGAVSYDKNRASFSSVGNSADGRIKPDVMAMGAGVVYVKPNGDIASGSGTSFASPLVSGLVAGLMQANSSLTHKEIIFAVKQSADRFAFPDSLYGYGIPNYQKASSYAKLLSDKESMYVYPNPCGAELKLKVPVSSLGKSIDWTLYTISGKRIASGQRQIESLVVSLWTEGEDLFSGVYLLRVSIDGVFHTFRVIK